LAVSWNPLMASKPRAIARAIVKNSKVPVAMPPFLLPLWGKPGALLLGRKLGALPPEFNPLPPWSRKNPPEECTAEYCPRKKTERHVLSRDFPVWLWRDRWHDNKGFIKSPIFHRNITETACEDRGSSVSVIMQEVTRNRAGRLPEGRNVRGSLLLAGLLAVLSPACVTPAQPKVNVTGSTFVTPMMSK